MIGHNATFPGQSQTRAPAFTQPIRVQHLCAEVELNNVISCSPVDTDAVTRPFIIGFMRQRLYKFVNNKGRTVVGNGTSLGEEIKYFMPLRHKRYAVLLHKLRQIILLNIQTQFESRNNVASSNNISQHGRLTGTLQINTCTCHIVPLPRTNM